MTDIDPYTSINLGQKRKTYNECIKYGINMGQSIISIDIAGEDVEKMIDIDIACAKADLRYVLDALAHEDILYVSRTIKMITGMITDQKYATIFNPFYLQANLFPQMTTKGANKLLKHIRLHLKDENRVEAFYKNEKDVTKALKWLPNCSIPFIEEEIKKHVTRIDQHLLKRLSEKSISIWKIVITHKDTNRQSALRSTLFVLYQDTDQYMDVIEKSKWHELPTLGVRGTQVIMKYDSRRVIEKIASYISIVDIPTFAKCLKAEEVRDVLYKITENCADNKNNRFYHSYSIFNFRNLICFIQQMPFNERFKFAKEVFIEKIHSNPNKAEEPEAKKMAKLFFLCQHINEEDYVWYQLATFDEAFAPITARIQKETRQEEKNSMLNTLLICARNNMQYITDILQYFNEKLINDKSVDKQEFAHQILSIKKAVHQYDEKTWALLHEILKYIGVYKESTDVSQEFIEVIIVYNVIKNKEVPESIEKKFEFNTLKAYGNQMNQTDKDKLFAYLYNYSFIKLENCKVDNEISFKNKIEMLHKVLLTLKDWNKKFADYPILLDKIREIIQIKSKNSWKADLSNLYNINKSWKKHMFEESLILSPSEDVCLNALKHDAGLLKRNENVLLSLTRNDKVSLQRLLSKVRIFWNQTLAKEWAQEYISRLHQAEGLEATVRGLCTILPQNQLLNIIKKYVPREFEINWEETDSITIGVQRNIAKLMHSARPQPPPEAVMSYAKGDYLQFSLPSVLAIFYNLSQIKTREFLPKLFNAPVSLQKHGLRLAVTKMDHEDIINVFSNIWKTSKNATIRAVIFILTFKLLPKERDNDKLKELINFLCNIIDNLSFEEDSTIYQLLGEVNDVPISIRPQYVEHSYNFVMKMLHSTDSDDRKNLELITEKILLEVKEQMQLMSSTFMTKLLHDFIAELSIKPLDHILHGRMKIKMLAKYLLLSDTKEQQNEKFNTLCKPYIDCVQKPGNKSLITRLEESLREYLVRVTQTEVVVPEILFSRLYDESLKILPISEHYVLLTELKLFTALMTILHKNKEESKKLEENLKQDKSSYKDPKMKQYMTKIMTAAAQEFGHVCVTYLREDIDTHFPLIYDLFSKSLNNVYETFRSVENEQKSIRNGFCTSMLQNKDFIAAYLVVLKVYSKDSSNHSFLNAKPENKVLLNLVLENESVEVRMHYNNMFASQYAF